MKIKKIVHHIRHTRPKWYADYHQWEHHATLHWITFSVSSVVILLGFYNVAVQMTHNVTIPKANAATTASTVLTQNVNAGTLTIANTGNQTMGAATVSTSSQNTSGSLGTITATDNRGSGVGWSTTATSTNFTFINAAVKVSGSNATVTSGGTYNAATAGTYTITITTGGAAGTAIFSVSGLETATSQTTGSGVAIGTHGVTATFGAATYAIGDSWTIRVDTIPVTNLQITPGSLTTISGSATGVTAGSVHTYTTTVDAASLITASAGNGLGSYSVAPALQLTVPANSYANAYTATVTETVQ